MADSPVEQADGSAAKTAAPQAPMWTPRKIYLIVMLTLIMLSNYLDRLIMTIVQEPIKLELGISDLQLGLLTGPAFGVLYALSALPIARLAERFDRITILTVSLTFWSGFTLLAAAVTSYVQLFLVRMGVGVSEGGGAPSIHSLVSDSFTARQRGLAIAITGLSMPLAGFLAPLAGAFVAHEYGWRWAFIAVGIPGLILALVFRLTCREPRKEAAKVSQAVSSPAVAKASTFLADMKWLVTNKPFVLIWLATATAAMVMTASLLFTASFLLRKFGVSLREAGIVLSIGLGLGGGIGAIAGGWLADRFAGKHGQSYLVVPSIGAIGAGIMYFMVYNVDSWELAGLLIIGASVFQSLKNGPNYAAVQTLVPPHMRATASAVLLLAISLVGGSIGPPLVGVISDWAANGVFPSELGGFGDQCHVLASDVPLAISEACAAASSKGLEIALKINAALYIVPVAMFMLAARYTRLDMDQ